MSIINNRTFFTALLGCTALAIPSYVFAGTTIPAKTSWAVSRVASASQGSYCAMAQKYEDATVMTFARNAKGEYSLALDFQEPQFKSGEKQTITLRPQGGAAQTYSVSPQSDRTAVIGIGKDAAMLKQLSSTENLGIDVAGISLSYALNQFSSGQKELGNCIEGLKTTKDKDAELLASQKTGMSSPEATVNRQTAVVRALEDSEPSSGGGNEPSVEGLLAAKPTPSASISALSSEDVIPAPVPVVPKNAPVKISEPVVDTKMIEQVAALREENARLTRAMAEQRQAFEDQQAAANGSALDEVHQKLDAAQAENNTLRGQLSQLSVSNQSSQSDQKAQLARLMGDVEKANQTTKTLQSENENLKAQLATQVAAVTKTNATATDVQKISQELETLKAENTTLRNQIQVYQSKQGDLAKVTTETQSQIEANAKLLSQLQSENAQLKAQIADKGKVPDMTAELERQKQSNAALLAENNTLKNQIQIYSSKSNAAPVDNQQLVLVQKENQDLKVQISKLSAMPVAAPAPVAAVNSEEADKLRTELRTLHGQFETAQADKMALQSQLADLQKKADGAQIKMAGGSWDLEQATRRYQESQREIQRLGAIVQTQQAKCTQEKKDIEYMLFDPAIAKSSQISMLNSLEDQIADKDKKIKAIEADLTAAKAQSSPDKDKKIKELEAQLQKSQADMSAQLAKASTTQDSVIASLKNEIAQKDKNLFDVQAKLADAQNKMVDSSSKENAVIAMKSQLEQKNLQLAEANAKIVQFAKGQSTMATTQEATINTLKSQLANTQAQLEATRSAAQRVDERVSADQAASLAGLQMQVQQGNQKIAELQSQVGSLKSASMQAAAVSPAAAPIPVPAPVVSPMQPISITPKVAPVKFMSKGEFSDLLQIAGVPVSGALDEVKGGDPSSYRAYSWKTSSLYGSVEMRRVASEAAFDSVIGQYLSRAKSRCSGEFAAVPASISAANVEQSKSYEIACVSQSASSSASVLFTYGNGIAMTVAHEGRAEAMDLAMDARDKIAGQIR